MIRASAAAALLLLTACAGPMAGRTAAARQDPGTVRPQDPEPATGQAAPPAEDAGPSPVRGEGPALPPENRTLTRIALGCCARADEPLPVFAAVAAARPDVFLFTGDVVTGLADEEDPRLPELRKAYEALNLNAHFSAFNMAAPMLAVPNAAGAAPTRSPLSERLFETYWGPAALGTDRAGAYGARIWGPRGRRVQIILLDARAFLDPDLAEAQRAWLQAELKKPAELRLLASAVPILDQQTVAARPDATSPEVARLLAAVRRSGAGGVVFLSGDPQRARLVGRTALGRRRSSEITSPSLNIGAAGFGMVEIDWRGRLLGLSLRAVDGRTVQALQVPFREIGL